MVRGSCQKIRQMPIRRTPFRIKAQIIDKFHGVIAETPEKRYSRTFVFVVRTLEVKIFRKNFFSFMKRGRGRLRGQVGAFDETKFF